LKRKILAAKSPVVFLSHQAAPCPGILGIEPMLNFEPYLEQMLGFGGLGDHPIPDLVNIQKTMENDHCE